MLLSLRQPAVAVFVPVILTAFTGAMVAVPVRPLLASPSVGGVLVEVFCGGLFLLMLSKWRVAWISGDRLVIAGLFGRDALAVDRTALGFEVKSTGRSIDYEIYATDGTKRTVLLDAWSRWGAKRMLARLERTFDLTDDAGGATTTRAPARAEVARLVAAQEAQQAQAKAIIDAHYAKHGYRMVFVALFVFVLLYAVAMGLYVALGER